MRWHSVVFAVGTLALSLAGCSDQTSAIVSGDAEREHLVQRTMALQASVVATGQINAEQRRELEDITQDIVEWQGRTGRTDLAVSRPAQSDGTAALISKGPTPAPCPSCPPVKVVGTQICFLVQSWCSPKDGLKLGCVYTCVTLRPLSWHAPDWPALPRGLSGLGRQFRLPVTGPERFLGTAALGHCERRGQEREGSAGCGGIQASGHGLLLRRLRRRAGNS